MVIAHINTNISVAEDLFGLLDLAAEGLEFLELAHQGGVGESVLFLAAMAANGCSAIQFKNGKSNGIFT